VELQTAGLAFGGLVSTTLQSGTEEYDGSAWTAGGNLGTARRNLRRTGLQTAGLAFGGLITGSVNNTEEYDGSAWTGGGNLGTTRQSLGGVVL
jgi:hypothetical protein